MVFCRVYKSSRKPDTYLYLPVSTNYESLPTELRQVFGSPEKVLSLDLDEDTRLVAADAKRVLQKIEDEGYYLQLPPTPLPGKHDPWV